MRIFLLQSLERARAGISRLAAPRLGERLATASVALLPPVPQMRVLQAFPPPQGADLAGLRTGVRFRKHAQLVGHGKGPALGALAPLGIREFRFCVSAARGRR